MAAIAQQYNKLVVLTEIGYQSRLGTHNMRSGDVVLDIQEQTDCYDAPFQALSGKPWLGAIFWWALEASLKPVFAGGPNDTNFTIRSKTAADVVKRYRPP